MRTKRDRRTAKVIAAAALALASLAGGCVSTGAFTPQPELDRARAAVRAAEDEGAATDPSAQVALAFAQHHLDVAARLLARGDRAGAAGLARRAEADAEIARLIAREAALRDAARRTMDQAGLLAAEAARMDRIRRGHAAR